MFIKAIKHYIDGEKYFYNHLISRRKERFIQLIELQAPKEIIIKEIELLRQPFIYYLRKKLQRRILRFVKFI
jgi:hypothetical protein